MTPSDEAEGADGTGASDEGADAARPAGAEWTADVDWTVDAAEATRDVGDAGETMDFVWTTETDESVDADETTDADAGSGNVGPTSTEKVTGADGSKRTGEVTGDDGRTDAVSTGDDAAAAVETLRARVDVLAAENRRLRERYERARRRADLRAAAGLAAVGVVAVAGGLALPGARTVLFALGGTGLLAAALVAGLSPTRSVAAEAAASVYGARARTGPALVADLGLADERVYLPTGAPGGDDPVRLFVPHHREYVVPDVEPGGPLVVATGDEREAGVALPPTAGALYRELRSWSPRDADAATLAEAVGDALGTGFGLVESVRVDVAGGDREGDATGREGGAASGDGLPPGRATFAVAGSDLGAVDRFDHPVASLAGVALAAGLSTPVAVSVRAAGDDRADFLVTCRWPAGGD